ncbi:MAG: Xaa-Pro peptidase family protein [Thermoproteota archaeon]
MIQVFSRSEIARRLNSAQALMKRNNIDALLITNEENFQYFTGLSGTICLHYSNARPAILVIPSEGEPIAIVGSATEDVVKEAVKDVRSYTSTMGIPTELYVSALKDADLRAKRVGIEEGLEMRLGIPVGELLKLMKALPEVEFIDIAPLIWELRMIKSREEQDYMRKAAEVTGIARQKVFDLFQKDMTHRQVARLFSKLMLEEGADRIAFVHVGCKEPLNHTQFHLDVSFNDGDILYLDGGCYVRMHTIDYPRLAVVGKASEEMRKYHKVLVDISRKMADFIRPGITTFDVWKRGYDLIKEAGFRPFDVGRMGHGQGMLPTEPPSVSSEDRTILKPGMVISTEPLFKSGKDIIMIWEDVHVVTEDGHEQITLETEELREVG